MGSTPACPCWGRSIADDGALGCNQKLRPNATTVNITGLR
jgi:hypothetical protein